MKNDYFFIKKNQSHNQIIDQNLKTYSINLFFYKLFLKIILFNEVKIHYGKFEILKHYNFIDLVKIITAPSNFYKKITIIEGWSKKDLNKVLRKNFKKFDEFNYDKIIADTYYINNESSFNELKKIINKSLRKSIKKYNNSNLSDMFSFKEILVIGSLLEKEGIDYNDKKNIFSVIINRLNNEMKLQIDATVIYALTEGKTKLNRKLTYKDLKIRHNYNTYHIYGLPPEPISYVGLKTIELIFENYKTNYLYYFYNRLENKHIYSIIYKNHLM